MADDVLLIETKDRITTLTMNRPRARNALSFELRAALTAAFREFSDDPQTGVIILTGTPPAFCAGLDLKELGGETEGRRAAGDPMAPVQNFDLVKSMEECAAPIIGAINGVAITGGFEVALGCDVLIASTECCRAAKVEVIYTVIENLTLDGRDRGLDYKITGFNVPKGSWDAQVLSEIAPEGDEMVFPKTSSNVFVSTHLDHVLRNMGKRQIVMSGFITDQCVSSAVRSACDLGYLVTVVTDACASYSLERHTRALTEMKGYCRQVTTDALCAELGAT